MSSKLGKKLSFILALALLFGALAPLPASAAGTPYVVNGRTLATGKTGDNSEWIEIARYGGYSLILRKNQLQESYFGENNLYQN